MDSSFLTESSKRAYLQNFRILRVKKMCFVTHNRLILLIAILSILLGLLTFISSSLIIHHAEQLDKVTIHIKFLIACTFCTIIAGILQASSSLFLISRRLIAQHWITTNAFVFGIFLLGICTAMVRFQSNLPQTFDNFQSANHSKALCQTSLQHNESSTQSLLPTSLSSAFDHLQDKNITHVEISEDSEKDDQQENENEENTPSTNSYSSSLCPVEIDSDRIDATLTLSDEVAGKLLKLYFGSIMADFLLLPIFLGLVSSKSSKYELRGRSLVEDYW